jgi:ubiquitin carboxyl-terminal hydrolase 7
VRNKYKLHSVLVHSGGVHGGHYYAYIRPDGKNWLKFDDTAVTCEDDCKALDEQFGGEDGPATLPTADAVAAGSNVAPKRLGGLKFTRFSNAYMLVYVRLSDWDRIMCPVEKEEMSPYLRERLEVG